MSLASASETLNCTGQVCAMRAESWQLSNRQKALGARWLASHGVRTAGMISKLFI